MYKTNYLNYTGMCLKVCIIFDTAVHKGLTSLDLGIAMLSISQFYKKKAIKIIWVVNKICQKGLVSRNT